jgi:phage shock protein PspC (stress-responsive transcriptional regulator)
MITTDPSDTHTASAGSNGAPPRVLRRSRSDRIGAGVAGGLGEYFGVDPVLFRVLFATAAFFGGAGVLAYLLAWAAIPEQGTEHAAVDRWVEQLRRRRVPVWLVAGAAGLVLWAVAFSWWAPGPFLPVLVAVIILVVVFGRRGASPATPSPATAAPATRVDLTKAPADAQRAVSAQPPWLGSARAWLDEARQASRERRHRAFPVKMAILGVLVATLIVLGVADAIGGIVLPAYFWATGGIVAVGLLVGIALGRTPWSLTPLLIPAIAGLIAFANTGASLHDGVGEREWAPTNAAQLHSSYRLAFGDTTLDLRGLSKLESGRTVNVTMAAGHARVLLPNSLNATVHSNVRIGEIAVDGAEVADTHGGSIRRLGGYDIGYTVRPPAGAAGAKLTVNIHLADGRVDISHG